MREMDTEACSAMVRLGSRRQWKRSDRIACFDSGGMVTATRATTRLRQNLSMPFLKRMMACMRIASRCSCPEAVDEEVGRLSCVSKAIWRRTSQKSGSFSHSSSCELACLRTAGSVEEASASTSMSAAFGSDMVR